MVAILVERLANIVWAPMVLVVVGSARCRCIEDCSGEFDVVVNNVQLAEKDELVKKDVLELNVELFGVEQ